MLSPGFSKFRELMDVWDEYLVESDIDQKINTMLSSFIFFFEKDKQIYGAGEDSRVIFAKMKNPDADLPKDWAKEASFSAINLNKSLKGEMSQYLFQEKDLKEIKVIEKDKAESVLKKESEKLGEKAVSNKPTMKLIDLSRIMQKDRDEPFNFNTTNEE